MSGLDISAMQEAIRTLKEKAPKRREIWITKLVPHLGEDGEPFIVEIDVVEFAKNSSVSKYIPAKPIETVTGADIIMMMNPMTLSQIENMLPDRKPVMVLGQNANSMGGIPCYTDEQRRVIFKERHERRVKR